MLKTPISDAAMSNSEPHGFEVVPYLVARNLELELDALTEAAQAVVGHWDTPEWKDESSTAFYINRLRATLLGWSVPK